MMLISVVFIAILTFRSHSSISVQFVDSLKMFLFEQQCNHSTVRKIA